MRTILEYLGTDHRACDDLFASAEEAAGHEDWNRGREMFGKFQAAMARHLAMEEDVLFPAFEERTGMRAGPTQVMRMEHAQMRELIDAMAQAVDAGDAERFLGLSETLNVLMQQHNLKEENMLYPMSDRTLGEERERVLDAMDACLAPGAA
ncbi:MAG: hemerythrin domain-containing protein [Pseudomonadota bacterium]